MIALLVGVAVSFLFCLLVTPLAIRAFRRRNIGQFIQEDVEGHMHKRGTPTMGVRAPPKSEGDGFVLPDRPLNP